MFVEMIYSLWRVWFKSLWCMWCLPDSLVGHVEPPGHIALPTSVSPFLQHHKLPQDDEWAYDTALVSTVLSGWLEPIAHVSNEYAHLYRLLHQPL